MNFAKDTIVAQATPLGSGALSVIRLSGAKSLEIALKITHLPSLKKRYATLSNLYDLQNNLLDEAIVIYFPKPHSYTTEEVVEFQCHGSVYILQTLIEMCCILGARLAQAGEFTKRAFLGGRIDLAQANAIAQIITNDSKATHNNLMRHLNGEFSSFCNALREELIEILAHSEVCIDYAEEDLPPNIIQNLIDKINSIEQRLATILALSLQKKAVIGGYKICMIGKPNVGKSSLLNTLLGENRAIVSEIKGTTRDSIAESFYFSGHLLRLIDTAGIRSSSDTIEQLGIQRSTQEAINSDIIVAVFDKSKPLDSEDQSIIDLLQSLQDKKLFILLNKSDLSPKLTLPQLPILKNALSVSVTKNDINAFLKALKAFLEQQCSGNELLLNAQFQYDAIKEMIENLQQSIEPLKNGVLEIFSFHISQSLNALCKLTRPFEYGEMLDKLFSQFCLGK